MWIIKIFLLCLFSLFNLSVFAQQDQTTLDGIMVTRGQGFVSQQTFDAKVSRIPAKDRTGVLRSGERVKKILADLVLNSQLTADAIEAGFDKGEVQFRMKLAAETELASAWLDYYVESQPDADYRAMAHEYYLLNPKKFETKPSRDVTHLLVSIDERSEEEAKELARSLLDQVKLNPGDFDELILEHSEDSSAHANKGHFMTVKKGDMVKPFEEAAFSLQKPGEFSDLVHSQFGIHIIRLDEIHPVRTIKFEEVHERLELIQATKHRERIRYAYLNELTSLENDISEEEIRAMLIRYFGEDMIEEHTETPEPE